MIFYSFCRSVDFTANLKIFTLLHLIYIYLIFYVRRMGRQMVPRVKDNNSLWHAKDHFTGFQWRVGSWGLPRKLQNFKTEHFKLIVAAVIKYCRYGVKHNSINQSILKIKTKEMGWISFLWGNIYFVQIMYTGEMFTKV